MTMNAVEIFSGVLFLIIGSLSFIAAIVNPDWFFKTRNATFFVRLLGRNWSRVVYGVFGLAAIAVGILFITGTVAS